MKGKMLLIGVAVLAALGAFKGVTLLLEKKEEKPKSYASVIKFVDNPKTNAELDPQISELKFVGLDGKEHGLEQYRGNKHVVLVITRGDIRLVCPYCTSQTARLIENYKKISEREAEVVLVYPVRNSEDEKGLDKLLAAVRETLDDDEAKVPFPICFDPERRAVKQLKIEESLSKPATYIIDRSGKVRFAYVGHFASDRPSVDAILKQLDAINQG